MPISNVKAGQSQGYSQSAADCEPARVVIPQVLTFVPGVRTCRTTTAGTGAGRGYSVDRTGEKVPQKGGKSA
jgi:hypothetical protein